MIFYIVIALGWIESRFCWCIDILKKISSTFFVTLSFWVFVFVLDARRMHTISTSSISRLLLYYYIILIRNGIRRIRISCTPMPSANAGYIISVGHSFNQIITDKFFKLRLFFISMKQHDDQIIKTLDFIIKLWSYSLNQNIVLHYSSSNQLCFQYYGKTHFQFNLDFLIRFSSQLFKARRNMEFSCKWSLTIDNLNSFNDDYSHH